MHIALVVNFDDSFCCLCNAKFFMQKFTDRLDGPHAQVIEDDEVLIKAPRTQMSRVRVFRSSGQAQTIAGMIRRGPTPATRLTSFG